MLCPGTADPRRKPGTLAITVNGALRPGIAAKDLVLAIICHVGVAGGARQAIEYRGPAIRALSMEERMTVCNMSIEAGAGGGGVREGGGAVAVARDR